MFTKISLIIFHHIVTSHLAKFIEYTCYIIIISYYIYIITLSFHISKYELGILINFYLQYDGFVTTNEYNVGEIEKIEWVERKEDHFVINLNNIIFLGNAKAKDLMMQFIGSTITI